MTIVKVVIDFTKILIREYIDSILLMLILTSTLSLGFNFLLAIQLGVSNELDIYIYSLALPTFISSNSSLSWWASFLNVHDKPVIYSPWEKHLHVSSWKEII